MELKHVLAAFAVVVCSNAQTTKNRIGLDRPTDQPVQANEQDLTALLNDVFSGSNSVTQPTPLPNQDQPGGRVPENNNVNSNPGDCQCVPYYQCSTNRTIIENGEGLIDIRMKEGPCEDYMDVCCGGSDTLPPDEPIVPTANPTIDTCGRRNINGVSTLRITGAEDNEAQFGEFPWVVAILRREAIDGGDSLNVYQCGGSLIHPSVVLTAAHCVQGKSGLTVRAGEWDTQRKTEPLPTQNRAVREVVVHEQYTPGPLYNDVALLFLDSPVELAANVAPICLPEQDESMDNRNCVASGWGKDIFGKEGKYQVILKKVELPMVSRARCISALRQTRLGKFFKLHESFVCAGGIQGKDTCQGDGGSPLVCPSPDNPQEYVQAGIVAWGVGCGTETPGVYVDVAKFRNWIDNKSTMYNIDVRDYKKNVGVSN